MATDAIKWILTLAVAAYVMFQVRKPSRGLGRFFLWMMNRSHSALTDWGLGHVTIGTDFAILDVGCGGGRTLQKMATIATQGMLRGIDYADGSVAASRATNAKAIEARRMEILQASVDAMPLTDGAFDLVTAVETQYYWPDPLKGMKEVARVVKPGGTVLVIAESYKGGRLDWLQWPFMWLLGSTHLGVEEQKQLFAAAGIAEVRVFQHPAHGWICVVGRKSA